MSIRVLIVDDEPLARLGVLARLKDYPDMTVVGECATGNDALRLIPMLTPDLIFLDIEMPGITGFDLLQRLPKTRVAHVVFLTAHDEYALHAFEVEALDYLLKPLDPERFATCIDRVRRSVALHRRESVFDHVYDRFIANHPGAGTGPVRRFAVRRGHDVTFVNAADVDWIEGLGDYAGLHVQRKTHLIRQCLSALAKDLDSTQFLRIHRSTIVQIDRIVRVEPLGNRDAVVTLRDSQTLRASRSYTSSLYGLLRNTRAG